jgi:hypothetical protein
MPRHPADHGIDDEGLHALVAVTADPGRSTPEPLMRNPEPRSQRPRLSRHRALPDTAQQMTWRLWWECTPMPSRTPAPAATATSPRWRRGG